VALALAQTEGSSQSEIDVNEKEAKELLDTIAGLKPAGGRLALATL
jgi:hypothetical protein